MKAVERKGDMHFRMKLIRLVIILVASWAGQTPVLSQSGVLGDLCDMPRSAKVKGILSFRATKFLESRIDIKLFLAVWHELANGERIGSPLGQLVVYEKDGFQCKEVFRFADKAQMEFLEFAPLSSLTVPGVVVTFSSDIAGWKGPTLVVALVHEKFEIVYEGAPPKW